MHPNFAERLFTSLHRQAAHPVLHWLAAPGAAATAVTGAGLLARVAAWQRALQARCPLAVGTPVLLLHPGSPELVAALLAVLGLGGVAVLPPAGAGARQLLALARAESIRLVVTASGLQTRWGWLLRLLGCRAVAAAPPATAAYTLAAIAARPELRLVPLAQPALLSHSSGSASRRPSAVRRSHQVLQAQHEELRRQFPPWPGQRDFPLFPNVILHNLAVEALSVVPDLPGGQLARLDPARIVAQLRRESVETLTGNVFYFQALATYLAQHPTTFPQVRALGIGGSPVPDTLLAALLPYFPQAARYVIYGSSEAEPIAVRLVLPGPTPDPRQGYCVGFPVAGLAVRLHQAAPAWQPTAGLPPAGATHCPQPNQPFQVGEILVRGAHVALPTAATDGWLPTGDFGYFDQLGQLWLVGRRGAATLVRGVGHYQLEHLLRQLPGVAQVAALPCPRRQGFAVFLVGPVATETVVATVAAAFGSGLVAAVNHRDHLPVDGRHLSKIRYDLVG